jgi:TolB-like protein/Tfp pilus assembly protein PilF
MDEDETMCGPETLDPRSGLSHDAIRAQLDHILGHREFQATDRMRDFLQFVVEETLAGRSHRLKGYTIATNVFGRGNDFDAAQDPIVRIQAGRLRRALERYYLVGGVRDPVFIDIPKGGYIPRFTAQTAAPDRRRANGPGPSGLEPGTDGRPSVAVLPFENLTGDAEQLFFGVGLAEDLVTEMTRFQDLVVIPCRPAADAAGLPADPLDLARAAGARFVLQGAVRRDAETVKVSTRLTDVKSGTHVWAEAYTHPIAANELIATQEKIASSVVATVASEYGIIARRLSAESRKKAPTELDTYEAMLRYYAHQIAPDPEGSDACFATLQQAVEREPEYGPAWSALATLYCQMYSMDVPGFDRPLERGIEYAQRAVTLEPGIQLCRLILAYACFLGDDSDCFQQEAETALTLNPNSPYAVGAVGYFHTMRGEFDRGLPLLNRAIAMNPHNPDWFHSGFFVEALSRRDYEGALRVLQQRTPAYGVHLPLMYAATLAKLGRLEEARAYVEQLNRERPDFASRARELLRRTLKVDVILDDLVDGMHMAGMPVGS